MEELNKFLNDRKAVAVASTLILFGLAVYFFFIGILDTNIVYEILSLESETLFRLWNIVLGGGVLFVAYGLYKHNKADVDASLSVAKDKVTAEAKVVASKVDQKIDEVRDEEKSEETKDNVEKKAKRTEKKAENSYDKVKSKA